MLLWAGIFATAVKSPPLLDDADATHAQAAQAMLVTGDYVTLHVNGIRYLEKPPLPYWVAAASLHVFGESQHAALAIHLPLALTVLALALLAFAWGRRAFRERTGLYAAVFLLTAAGVFLFTRVFIPDALLSLLLALALYWALDALDGGAAAWRVYGVWAALACAVLTKGLVALVFFFATIAIFTMLTKTTADIRRLRPFSGVLLMLAIAAPWHVLAGLRNTGGEGGHGFFWFYFVNEHWLRFLGQRIPRDYNKLPTALYWSLHLVWLFPWSLFGPAALIVGWQARREQQTQRDVGVNGAVLSRIALVQRRRTPLTQSYAERSVLLLLIFSALVLVFFSLSTNQEYYTFPVYLPLLLLIASAVDHAQNAVLTTGVRQAMTFGFGALTVTGLAIAAALAYGLWSARGLPFVSDIGTVLNYRGVGGYTLSMSHFFDLTGPSFAALRLPAALAAMAFAVGPVVAWVLHARKKAVASVMAIAVTAAAFLLAAHIALVRFAPMLSSENFVATIERMEATGAIEPGSEVMLYGDQAFGSSIPFYLHRRVKLVEGRSTSMLFGSTFADAPSIFLTHEELAAQWGVGTRRMLFVPQEHRMEVEKLLGARAVLVEESSGKALFTDRPLTVTAEETKMRPTSTP